jgi:hypothetical protein
MMGASWKTPAARGHTVQETPSAAELTLYVVTHPAIRNSS